MTTDPVKQLIFDGLGITDTAPWEALSTQELLKSLRRAAGKTQKDVAGELHLSQSDVFAMEHSARADHVSKLISAIKPALEARVREGWLSPGSFTASQNAQIRMIFAETGINDTTHWTGKSVPEIMTGLRESAAYTLEDIGTKLNTTRQYARLLETSGKPGDVEKLLGVFVPRLKKLVAEGWLKPDSLLPDTGRMDNIARASHDLRTLGDALNPPPDYGFDVRHFEGDDSTARLAVRLSHFIANTQKLCEHYQVETPDKLIEKAQTVTQGGFRRYDAGRRREVGKATGAILEYLGLTHSVLADEKALSRPRIVSRLAQGENVERGSIERMPVAIKAAYARLHPDQDLPEEARFSDAREMTQKGLRLAGLKKNHLRTGVRALIQEQQMLQETLSQESGVAISTLSKFLNSPAGHVHTSLHHIAKLADPLGMSDIFALEEKGRDVNAQGKTITAGPVSGYAETETHRRLSDENTLKGR